MTVLFGEKPVLLTKKQAEYLERMKAMPNREATLSHLREISSHSGLKYDEVVRALYVGYTVEKTQEEREADVKAYFEENVSLRDNSFQSGVGRARFGGKTDAIKSTLDLLGITIAGVND